MVEQRLWLYRTKPREDELFSSWLVRLAHGLAVKIQPFVVHLLGMSPGFWTDDVDRYPNRRALRILSAATAVPMARLDAIGLSAYQGFLWPSFNPKGALAWVMPIGRNGRRRRGHGQLFCRQCLAADEQPYFRRRWRLAFNVACELHDILLDDACRICGAPIEFHVGDFGKRLLDFECHIARCGTCGADYRTAAPEDDRPVSVALLAFQSELNVTLRRGWSPALPGGVCYSFLAFEGLRCIVRLLVSHSRAGRLRDQVSLQEGDLPLNIPALRPQPLFEELRVGDRARILRWCADITRSWPDEFIRLCREARVSSTYILLDKKAVPYWLASVTREHLFDGDYRPARAEWAAASAWLEKVGYPVTANSVRRLLGLSHTRAKYRPDQSGNARRWNPRGPRH